MKKMYLTLALMLMGALSLTAQVNVTFQVDMNTQMNVDTVSFAGNFQAAAGGVMDWNPGEFLLTDGDNDGVYDTTITLPAGTYQYKFLNGPAWGTDESVPGACANSGNREFTVSTNDTTLGVVCFGTCTDCPLAPPDTVNVILEVDMSNVPVSTDTAYVAGNFQGAAVGEGWNDWTPDVSYMLDSDNDSVYTISFRLPEGTYAYKFLNAAGWGNDEGIPAACNVGGNREMVISSDTVIRYCYGTCDAVCVPPLPPINVTFRVDMSTEFPSADGIFIAGTFQTPNWVKNTDKMTQDPVNTDIYSYTVSLVPGEYAYKYFNGDYLNSSDPNNSDIYAEDADFLMAGCGVDNGIGGSNRLLDIQGMLADTVLPVYQWNSCMTTNVSIEQDLNSVRGFSIEPNPFEGFTMVRFSNPQGAAYQVEVMNMAGQVVKRINSIRDNEFRLDATDLTSGMYLISLKNSAGERFTAKAVVR